MRTFFSSNVDHSTATSEMSEILDVLTTKTSQHPEIIVVDTDASYSSGFELFHRPLLKKLDRFAAENSDIGKMVYFLDNRQKNSNGKIRLERHLEEERSDNESSVETSNESDDKVSKETTECCHSVVEQPEKSQECENLSNNLQDRQFPEINVVYTDVSSERPTVDTNSTSVEKVDDEICAMRLATDLVS
jgi:hypothetical protein